MAGGRGARARSPWAALWARPAVRFGAPVLAASNRVISQLRAALGTGFPIIGVGGVMSGADAVSKIKAGADVVVCPRVTDAALVVGPAARRRPTAAARPPVPCSCRNTGGCRRASDPGRIRRSD